MKYFLMFLVCGAMLTASEKSREEYLEFIKLYPTLVAEKGDATKGEIEILTSPEKMAEIEAKIGRDVGLMKRDKYWTWINDAVRFPSGAEGVYGRILWNKACVDPTRVGVCVMPFIEGKGVVLNCNYRHATRSWELELPRGGLYEGETVEAAATRETLEETGSVIHTLTLLGHMAPDSGTLTTIVPVYYAMVQGSQESMPENSEAIEKNVVLSMEELKKAIEVGYYDCTIRGEKKRVFCRDPFLTYAVLLCVLKQL